VKTRIAVFASGGGSNLQALLDYFNTDIDRGGRVMLVISDRAGAAALRRAANVGVMTQHIAVTGRSEEDVAAETLDALAEEHIDVIALAGYLRLVPPQVIRKYRNRVVNIHPALLPAFGGPGMYGRHVHEAVLAAGCMLTGATAHYVDERYDEGRIIAQWPVPVLPGDSADSLAARVLRVEHMLYPVALEAAVRRVATGATGAPSAATAPGATTAASEAAEPGEPRDDLAFALHPGAPELSRHITDLLHP
jgi:formyltetrahydrofolate-dependent phosphoribosylglycinamide formyltransferase